MNPNIAVTSGTRYAVVVKTTTTTGCYGMEYSDAAPYPGGGAAYSNNSGASFAAEANRTLKFQTTVHGTTSLLDQREGWMAHMGAGVRIAVPGGMSGFELFGVSGQKIWEIRGLQAGERFVLPGGLPHGAMKFRWIPGKK